MTDRNGSNGPIDIEKVEALLRELPTENALLEDPPAALWDRIVGELDATAPGETSSTADISFTADAPVEAAAAAAPVIVLDSRRRRLAPVLLAAAAALVLVLAGAVIISNRSGDSSTVVATAELSYDETFDELGVSAVAGAELVENDDGSAEIRIVGASLPSPTDEPVDLELWLIEPDAEGSVADLVSLGLIDPARPGVYEVPDGYDPGTFFVVDISVEPRDGEPTHSGRSILRGALVQA
jgi:anti-sigma-K factor RskA